MKCCFYLHITELPLMPLKNEREITYGLLLTIYVFTLISTEETECCSHAKHAISIKFHIQYHFTLLCHHAKLYASMHRKFSKLKKCSKKLTVTKHSEESKFEIKN